MYAIDIKYTREFLTGDTVGVVGTPDQGMAKLQHFQQICGPQEVMGWFNTGGRLPHHQGERSMRLFAQEVMPHFLISVLH